MYHVVFKYIETINLGRCVIDSQTDTTLSCYCSSTDDHYVDFSTTGTNGLSYLLNYGERLFFKCLDFPVPVFLGRVTAISSSAVTISENPGQKAYNEVLQYGYIEPFATRSMEIRSYPTNKYIGANLNIVGEKFTTFTTTNPNYSAETNTEKNSVISLFFEKGDKFEEVKISVKVGEEASVIKAINLAFRQEKDYNFSSSGSTIHPGILSVNSIVSPFVKGDY